MNLGDYCTKCGAWLCSTLKEGHTCPPTWFVWCPEDGEDEGNARTVYAQDEDGAAGEYAKESCGDDLGTYNSYIYGGKDVVVKNLRGETYQRHVYGEVTIDFYVKGND